MAHHAREILRGDGPLVADAIHDGDSVRADVRPLLALFDAARLTEQNPYTSSWTTIAPTRIVGNRPRFEFDLNRPRDKAVYLQPADSWGLKVWSKELPSAIVNESLRLYDSFHEELEGLLEELIGRHRRLIVFDLHTYDHSRLGPYAERGDPERNPEVNAGMGTMDRRRWSNVVDRFVSDLRHYNFLGCTLDVRENVKFFGGNLRKWPHSRFPDSMCVLSIEFKKFCMDEWTGQVDIAQSEAIKTALAATVPGVLSERVSYQSWNACEN